MADGKLRTFLDVFGLSEDIEEDDTTSEVYEEEESYAPKKTSRTTKKTDEYSEPESAPVRTRTSGRSSRPKVVAINNTPKTMKVEIVKATSFDDAQSICGLLLEGRPVIVNLEGFQPSLAQRTMDFICGCMLAIEGKYHQISHNIFLFSPSNVDISGDSISYSGDDMSQSPTINTDF